MPNCDVHKMYMNIASEISNMSYANRLKVGAILVKNNSIISYGYNGMPSGFINVCETDNVTNPEVLHAESNAIMKVCKSTQSSEDATLYVTTSPCFECSKLIIQAGIKNVYYKNIYRYTGGIELLKKANINIIKLK
jgi:dCMP deaminase